MCLAGWAAEASIIKTAFRCEDGTVFAATFDNDASTLTLEFAGGVRVVLNQGISGSGIRYAGDGYEFYGKGKWGNVVRPGQPELHCEEAEPAAKPAPEGDQEQ
jgi:membrane-bound inhibitor of C-type lysozyme